MNCKECEWRKRCRSQCRQLAEGEACGQCARFFWCQAMYGIEASNTMCVVVPPKFEREGPEKEVRECDH